MANMKNSGIEWVGYVPYNWHERRLKNLYKFEKGKNAQMYTNEYIGQNLGEYPVYSGQTENNGIMGKINSYDYDLDECLFTTTVGAKCMTLKLLKGKFSLSQNCLIMKLKSKNYINRYIYYALTPLFENEREKIPSYMQPSLRIEDMNSFKLYLPQQQEQKLIADFLDEKVDIIDNIICDLNNQIEILNKYKNQLISEVVTRGLNKKVAMKDSEVEWIGSIPEHWNIKLIKNICSLKGRIGWEGLTKDEYISEGPTLITGINFNNGSIDWDSCEHVSEWRYNQDKSIQIKNKDLLITKDGTVGKVAIVKDCPEKVTLNSGVLLLRPLNNEYIEKYLYYVLLSNEFWHWFEIENIGNTTIIHLYQNRFAKFKLTLPPFDEQITIVDYLDKKCSEIEEILNSKIKQKEQMEQYKKSVIYEYVTGKKRVEGAEELYE